MSQTTQRRWPLLFFRIVVIIEVALLGIQVILAGSFLSGHYVALAMHEATANALGLVSLVVTIAAVLWWRMGSGPGWSALVSAAVFVAIGVQHALGVVRILSLHVPLGVLITMGVAFQLAWSLRYPRSVRARQPEPAEAVA